MGKGQELAELGFWSYISSVKCSYTYMRSRET